MAASWSPKVVDTAPAWFPDDTPVEGSFIGLLGSAEADAFATGGITVRITLSGAAQGFGRATATLPNTGAVPSYSWFSILTGTAHSWEPKLVSLDVINNELSGSAITSANAEASLLNSIVGNLEGAAYAYATAAGAFTIGTITLDGEVGISLAGDAYAECFLFGELVNEEAPLLVFTGVAAANGSATATLQVVRSMSSSATATATATANLFNTPAGAIVTNQLSNVGLLVTLNSIQEFFTTYTQTGEVDLVIDLQSEHQYVEYSGESSHNANVTLLLNLGSEHLFTIGSAFNYTVAEFLEELYNDELSDMFAGNRNSQLEGRKKLIPLLNAGMTLAYAKWDCKLDSVQLPLNSAVHEYTVPSPDLLQVIRVVNVYGIDVPQSEYTVLGSVIRFHHPTNQTIEVIYKTRHIKYFLAQIDSEVPLKLPEMLVPWLKAFVCYRFFAPMKTEDAILKAADFANQADTWANIFAQTNTTNEFTPPTSSKLYDRGFA